MISAVLLIAGVVLVLWAKNEDGWEQAWRVEVGAAIALLGPLFFIEEMLRSRVVSLEEKFDQLRKSYGLMRGLLPPGDARTYVLDRLLSAVTEQARAGYYSAPEISRLLDGDDETRMIALAIMQGDHRLIKDEVIINSIGSSKSGMEQYHALKAAHDGWSVLVRGTKRSAVDKILEDASGASYIITDAPRRFLAEEILGFALTDGVLTQAEMDGWTGLARSVQPR
ncbi:hypothetical protein Ari01nite_51160 [Paractinoplanes rishiriensis]|uniref:Uncharacterized protein n=1 Tax=Paractinoplanes rishiriensis TaxID=1050105 RepID=A0A919JYN6_9ACTN|nr:hypothetical protein Ari01nite_51160 [Actinoplanes rishiriensis]